MTILRVTIIGIQDRAHYGYQNRTRGADIDLGFSGQDRAPPIGSLLLAISLLAFVIDFYKRVEIPRSYSYSCTHRRVLGSCEVVQNTRQDANVVCRLHN